MHMAREHRAQARAVHTEVGAPLRRLKGVLLMRGGTARDATGVHVPPGHDAGNVERKTGGKRKRRLAQKAPEPSASAPKDEA